MSPAPASTLVDRIWSAHAIVTRDTGLSLLRIDRHYLHEGSFHAFGKLLRSGRRVRRPGMTVAFADHYVPTDAPAPKDREIAGMLTRLADNAAAHGIPLHGLGDATQGIVHVAAPELGLTLPGMTVVCGDSHTSTHGAFGALGFGIGASEVEHVLATQTLWQPRSKTMRVSVEGVLAKGVGPKDVILALIARIGAGGAGGHVIEYAGSTVRGLSMEGRMTLCNMSIEAGARAGLVAPDDTTFAWLAGRPHAPSGAQWDRALALWRGLATDPQAAFDTEVALSAEALAPMVTWGTSPETAVAVSGRVPDPQSLADVRSRQALADDLAYMGLTPGARLDGLPVDSVFVGSCTNARLEDLRAAAAVFRGRRVAVPTIVVPGSAAVRRQAEAEGLDAVFAAAGADFRETAGCSMCAALNGDQVAPGRRCASTSNRNFRGRQGPGSRTHLMSPAMAAAAALTGRITDVRRLLDA